MTTGKNQIPLLESVRDLHIRIETVLRQFSVPFNRVRCAECPAVRRCCKESICRESVESDFLRFVLGDTADTYDKKKGWLAPEKGCRLAYGRPLICYEFFCCSPEGLYVNRIEELVSEFSGIYANVLGKRHILEVEDIRRIRPRKLEVVRDRLIAFEKKAGKKLREYRGLLRKF